MYTKKAFILLENILSNFILLVIFLIVFKIGLIFLDKNLNYNTEYENMEIILNVAEDIANSIELRELVTDDFHLTKNRILIRINEDILKYEFENNKIYISSLENSKNVKLDKAKGFKYRVSVAKVEKVEFFKVGNEVIIFIKNGKFQIERRVNL